LTYTRLITLSACFLCASCATQQRLAPRFVAPSTAPIAKAQAAIAQRQVETQQHIQKAQEIVKTLTITLPADKLKVDALTEELNSAQASNDQLRTENDSLKGANEQLTTQILGQTQQANQLATDYDKCGAEKVQLAESRHGWVKRFWIASGLLLLAGLWIFKKPLLMMAGGMGI
jgi:septal ring factor EnvC (AmiA/AmiB activator)